MAKVHQRIPVGAWARVCRIEQRAALSLYLPVGYPSRAAGLDALHLMAQHADVLELGVPHTDPRLQGPVIQQAAAQALAGGFSMLNLFTATTELTALTSTALVVASYWTPIERFGPQLFAERLAVAGSAGVLIPDLPDQAAVTWRRAAREAGLHTIPLIPVHASPAHLAEIGTGSSGMVYAPATPGRTGVQRPLSPTCRVWSDKSVSRPVCPSQSGSASAPHITPRSPPATRTP